VFVQRVVNLGWRSHEVGPVRDMRGFGVWLVRKRVISLAPDKEHSVILSWDRAIFCFSSVDSSGPRALLFSRGLG
jgi:hypothetical protein